MRSYISPQGNQPVHIPINKTQYFEDVSPQVWDFHIGGYHVAEKWLKDRKVRTLTFDDLYHNSRVLAPLQ
ncbi:MAG TPA: type ISP restriction/modification enzyme [Chloroflexia bacterium]|nr:type ISP restriction/modification enzyme [Chloroflexia bacterium]